MLVDIYRSSKNDSNFISFPTGTDITQIDLPEDVEKAFSQATLFKEGVDLQPGDKRIGIDSDDVIKQINDNGFATHGASVKFDIT
ncbi:hypothetical protein K0L52_003231 [Vibrio fluvialis]|nr:hypothetical protein [Vibrio fluvialis]